MLFLVSSYTVLLLSLFCWQESYTCSIHIVLFYFLSRLHSSFFVLVKSALFYSGFVHIVLFLLGFVFVLNFFLFHSHSSVFFCSYSPVHVSQFCWKRFNLILFTSPHFTSCSVYIVLFLSSLSLHCSVQIFVFPVTVLLWSSLLIVLFLWLLGSHCPIPVIVLLKGFYSY